jgi:Ca2+-binding RTX toxin-like protein
MTSTLRRPTLLVVAALLLAFTFAGVADARAQVKGKTFVGTNQGDNISGTVGMDTFYGLGRGDTLTGLAGNDVLYGGDGFDTLYGNGEDDHLYGGRGSDHMYGGPGLDILLAADGYPDVVNCGNGDDDAWVDSSDRVTNCEFVNDEPVPHDV